MLLSAKSGEGFQYLEHIIQKYVQPINRTETIFLKFNQSRKRAWLFNKNIVNSEKISDNGFSLKVVWSAEQKNIFNKIVN